MRPYHVGLIYVGNVLGSRGLVLLIIIEQIKWAVPDFTELKMTRFNMLIKMAVQLATDSAAIEEGGGVFITKISVIRIEDLAEVIIEELTPS